MTKLQGESMQSGLTAQPPSQYAANILLCICLLKGVYLRGASKCIAWKWLKDKQPNGKKDRGLEQRLLQRYTNDQQAQEKMLHIVSYSGNTVNNTVKSHHSFARMALIRKMEKRDVGKAMEKLESLHIVDRSINWHSHCGKLFLIKVVIELSYEPGIPYQLSTPKNWKSVHK